MLKRSETTKSRHGFLVIELAVGMSILVIGILGFLSVFQWNVRAAETTDAQEDVRLVFQSVSEQLQTTEFSELYATYNNKSIATSSIPDYSGTAVSVAVNCYVDEKNLPAEFGPVFDIDGTGALDNTNCAGDYKLLPVKLTATYDDRGTTTTQDLYVVLFPPE